VFEGLSRQPQFGVILAAEAALQVGGCSWRSLLAVQQSSEAAADRAAQSCIQQHAPHVLGVEPTTPNSTPKPKPWTQTQTQNTTNPGQSQPHHQVAIVQFGGRAFSTVPLTPAQWGACVAMGAASLLVRAGLRLVPLEKRGDGGRHGLLQ
jgi:hypothetical protein